MLEGEILRILREELKNYQELRSLSAEEKRAITTGKIEELKDILNKKERIIKEVQSLEEKLTQFRAEGIAGALSPDFEEIGRKIGETLNKVFEQEKENESLLKEKMSMVKKDLSQISEGKKARETYKKKGKGAKFVDKKK